MKLKITFLALTLIIFASCKQESHKEIRNAFRQYVDENFGNPKDMKEITSVELKDTANLNDIIDTAKRILELDSIAENLENKFMNWVMNKKNDKFTNKVLSEHRNEYLDEMKEIHYKLVNIHKYYMVRNTLKSKLDETKDIVDYYIHYLIKARIEVNGTKEIREYHVYVDKNGKIQIKDREMKKKEVPEYWTELGDAIKDLNQYSIKILNRQNRIKEILLSVGAPTDEIYN